MSRHAIKFGIKWKVLTPYGHYKIPLSVSAYRRSVALPGLILGLLPALLGIVFGNKWLLFYGLVMLAAASGDIIVLWTIRNLMKDAQVMDHPHRVGCWVLNCPENANTE